MQYKILQSTQHKLIYLNYSPYIHIHSNTYKHVHIIFYNMNIEKDLKSLYIINIAVPFWLIVLVCIGAFYGGFDFRKY